MPQSSRRDASLPSVALRSFSEGWAKEGVSPAPTAKHFRLIAYLRIDPEDDEPMTYEDACAEKDQQELMFPENIYCIEEMPLP